MHTQPGSTRPTSESRATGAQGVVQTPPETGAGFALSTTPDGKVRYGPLQASKWSRVTGPAMWGGMYRRIEGTRPRRGWGWEAGFEYRTLSIFCHRVTVSWM